MFFSLLSFHKSTLINFFLFYEFISSGFNVMWWCIESFQNGYHLFDRLDEKKMNAKSKSLSIKQHEKRQVRRRIEELHLSRQLK